LRVRVCVCVFFRNLNSCATQGLDFDPNTGTVSGRMRSICGPCEIRITGSNLGGSCTHVFTVTVLPRIRFSYSTGWKLTHGEPVALPPVVIGGELEQASSPLLARGHGHSRTMW
jgi:hypothetical protein